MQIIRKRKKSGENGGTHVYLMDKFEKVDESSRWDCVLYYIQNFTILEKFSNVKKWVRRPKK